MFLALAQLTNKAFTDAGKGRIRQSLTALVEVPTFQGRGLLQWMLSSFSWVEQNLLSDDLPYSNWPPLHEPSAAVQGALHWKQHKAYIDGLVQERRNSSALAIDMLSSRTYDMIVFLKSSQKDTPLAHEGKAWSVLSIY